MKQINLPGRRGLLVIALTALIALTAWGCGDGEEAEQGKQALASYGCGSCHTIPGVRQADGVVGPPLDFWGSRWYIAGTLLNEPDNLVRWVMDPQAIEPGTAMPQMGVSESDARNIGAFLYTLEARGRGHVTVRGFTGGTTGTPGVTEPPGSTGTPGATMMPTPTMAATPAQEEQVIEVQARNYEFEPATIQVPVNTPIRFVVINEDVYHTFTVKETREAEEILLNIEIRGGQTAEGTYTFQKPGSYYLYCIPHEALGMVGTIEVTE